MSKAFTNPADGALSADGRTPWTAPQVIGAMPVKSTAEGSIGSYAEGAPTPFGGTGSAS